MSLQRLSDQELLSTVLELTRRERGLTLAILLLLNEIERRKLHLVHAYRSMHDYCTRALGYSDSAASRRLRVARCVTRFPEVYGLLETNELTLSTADQVSRVITFDNKDALLARSRHRSQREVEAIVAEYEPRNAIPRDRVRTVVVRVPAVPLMDAPAPASRTDVPPESLAPNQPLLASGEAHNRNGCEYKDTPRSEVSPIPAPNVERRVHVQFYANEMFMEKVEKVRSLAWHRLRAGSSLQQVFELVMDQFIDKEDPIRRHERRLRRAERRAREEEHE